MQRAWLRHALRRGALGVGALLAFGATAAAAADNSYVQTNLVSNVPGLAILTDSNLVNPWGLSAGQTPVWSSNNGSATTTLYAGFTSPSTPPIIVPLVVTIPGGLSTGTVFNSSANPTDFQVTDGTTMAQARFLFATQNGTIVGWAPTVGTGGNPPPSTMAEIAATVPGAQYTGLTQLDTKMGSLLYAANFGQGRIDVWNGSWTMLDEPGAFTDPNLPDDYSPFNVQAIGNKIFVAYAENSGGDEVHGNGLGIIDEYTGTGRLLMRVVTHDHLNAPWGLVQAPGNFGAFGHDLLVGNFGNGRIHAYNIKTGEFEGVLDDTSGNALVIDGLWGIRFGNGVIGTKRTLLFAAGIHDEMDGLFGAITAASR